MDSAEHQHGASAAPPPKAAPLPSESNTSTPKNPARCNATPKATEAGAAVSTPPPTAASSDTTTPSKIALASTSSKSNSASKKRPFPTSTLSVPALKTGSLLRDKTAPTKAVAPPQKAKKTIKKKKKKFSSILSGMMKPKKTTPYDLQAEREALRENLGGGTFAKVAKI